MGNPVLNWIEIRDPKSPPAPFGCVTNAYAWRTFAVLHKGKVYSIDLRHYSSVPMLFAQEPGTEDWLFRRELGIAEDWMSTLRKGGTEVEAERDMLDQMFAEAEKIILSPLERLALVVKEKS